MRPVALQELKQLGDGKHWNVEQQLSELDSIGPVKGWLKALHRDFRGPVLAFKGGPVSMRIRNPCYGR